MTTTKPEAANLTVQGKTTSQEEAPPQTIIGTFPTLDSVLQAAIMARDKVGVGLSNAILKKYGCKIADLPQDKWQEAGEWFKRLAIPIRMPEPVDPNTIHPFVGLPTNGHTIIPSLSYRENVDMVNCTLKVPKFHSGGIASSSDLPMFGERLGNKPPRLVAI